MTIQNRIAVAVSAAILTVGLGLAPAANAADSMKGGMHKHMMKKHKSMMKGDAMSK